MSDFKKAKMTGWYDPGQLARTAISVAISTIFGRNADRRLFESAAKSKSGAPTQADLDLSGSEGEEFWFDYIADVGDGFNSTYTMAYHLTEPTLNLGGEETKRGQVLIFGGDEVYPIASKEFYDNNLEGPYKAAFPKKGGGDPNSPYVFAIPGNHDWYDSLVQFSFRFLEDHFGEKGKRWFCGWQLKQERSYFAIKLRAGWWLFGTDMQLGSALDTPQKKFFFDLVRNKDEFKEGDRIILCGAEPHWIPAAMYRDNPAFNNEDLGFFEGHILNHKVAIHIAGDRHYYRRHEEITDRHKRPIPPDSPGKIQKITAGGGGAFLHPTHNEKGVEDIGRAHKYVLKKSFPDEKTSSGLGWKNFIFPILNPKFGLVTAALYVLTSWTFIAPIGQYGLSDFWTALKVVLRAPVTNPFALFWIVAIFGGFWLFTDTNSRPYRIIGGALHGLAHLAGLFFVSWGVSRWIDPSVGGPGPRGWTWLQLALGALLIALGGYIVGPFIMGIYLFISLNIFGRHHNEAFSALKIEDYKNFVRFKIEANGDLAIYPVGVKKVIKKWRDGGKDERSVMPETIDDDNRPFLIEGPIRFSKSAVSGAPAAEGHEDGG